MMGPAVGTGIVCRALERMGVDVVHVNTTDDRRGSGETVFYTNVLDFRNVALAALHSAQMVWETVRHRPQLVYIPISQGRWGYARDAVLMTIARVLRRPIVVHLRGSNLQRFFSQSTRVERHVISGTLGWATYAIALTPQLRGVYDGLVPVERVRVLENAIQDP